MSVTKTAVAILMLSLSGCGYRLASRTGDVGSGRTIAVPTFANQSNGYRLEQRISEAVRSELVRRTHYTVTSDHTADVIVSGEVLGYGMSPTVFTQQGRASQYAVAIALKVKVTETATGKVLFQNNSWTFRNSAQLSQSPADFVPEDPAAQERLASAAAELLVADLIHRKR